MKKVIFLMAVCVLSFVEFMYAQECSTVTVEAFPMDPQSGQYSYFGVRVSLAQPYYQDVTVNGYIWDGPDDHGYNENHPYTLTIVAGSLSAETPADFYQTGPAAEGAANITSVSPCPNPSDLFINTPISDPNLTSFMMETFNHLSVNFSALSSELGLSHTISAQDIDFNNLYETKEANVDTVSAIVAPFLNNSSSSSINYAFVLYKNGTDYFSPMIVQSYTNQFLKYFDLMENLVITINNYNSQNYSFSTYQPNYVLQPVKDCGQAVVNCITDVYTNHGWLSVWATVQSVFIPHTMTAFAGVCVIKNCKGFIRN